MTFVRERRERNSVTLRLAAEQSETLLEMRKCLREEGFSFKPSTIRRAWEAEKARRSEQEVQF
jgi:hypothetical protein